MFLGKNAIRIRRDFFSGEVFNYHKMCKEIEALKNNPVNSYVLDYKIKMVEAIDKTFLQISRSKNGNQRISFLKDFFWSRQHRALYGFSTLHCIHELTGKRWIYEFLDDVAHNFGLVFDTEL